MDTRSEVHIRKGTKLLLQCKSNVFYIDTWMAWNWMCQDMIIVEEVRPVLIGEPEE